MARKKKEPRAVSSEWLTTYGDMITLVLCFFVMLYNPSEVDVTQLASMVTSFTNDPTAGGNTMSAGQLADLGNNINSLPSTEKGRSFASARKKAVSLFAPEIHSSKIRVAFEERGLVITLAADAFFKTASAELDIENTRTTLLQLAQFLSSDELAGRNFRIEGHSDSGDTDPAVWPSNWELSAARAINVLHFLTDFGANENRFQVAAFSDTKPLMSNETPEGRAYNRRVDIIILDDGHF